RERVGDKRERVTFTLPALEPGAIVEYRYRLNSESLLLFPTWYFQDDVPVLHSEFRATIPNDFGYMQAKQGTLPFATEESEQVNVFSGPAMRHRWVRTDVPALRDEPYMTTLEDYIHKIEFQLAEYRIPGYGYEKVLNTWEDLAEDLQRHDGFGQTLRSSRALRREVEALTAGLDTPEARLAAIYDFVRTAVRHDGRRGYLATANLKTTLEDRTGSAADINLLLVQMLREAGIEVQPVLLSTRDHGLVQTIYPLVNQFNYVVAIAEVGGGAIWLDATDPMRPMGILPAQALSGMGWVPNEDAPLWLRIDPVGRATRSVSFESELDAAGTLTVALRLRAEGYDAVWMRRSIEDGSPEAFMQDYLSDVPGLVLDSARVEHLHDLAEPLQVYASVRIDGYAQTAGDLVFFNPTLLDRYLENPFKSPERSFPVDFTYPRTHRIMGLWQLPDGYAVDEMPEPVRIALPERAATYRCQLAEQSGQLVVRRTSELNAPSVQPEAYADLRRYYDRMVQADDQMVVLKRAALEAADPTPTPEASAPEEAASGDAPEDAPAPEDDPDRR
ncbi:MAG: DUF3857 domain-containing protein, partial [Bacteroidota bacterium]